MARWAIAIHGGAGVDPNLPEQRQEEAKRVLARCLQVGVDLLRSGATALDVVEAVVRELETDPCFNSGRGSALTRAGTVEMEASIMDGNGRRCGAVSGVTTVRNPVSLARRVMDKSPHSYLAFQGAEDFARDQGLEVVDNSYFITEENVGMLKLAKEANTILFDYRVPLTGADTCSALAAATESHHGSNGGMVMNGLPISIYAPETVGCAVVDCNGFTAAATSTGGLMNKMTGRIGDSPLIGAGTYACGHCAVSCTGEGEAIIRSTLARDVAAVMEYKGARGSLCRRPSTSASKSGSTRASRGSSPCRHRRGGLRVQLHRHVQGLRHPGRIHGGRHLGVSKQVGDRCLKSEDSVRVSAFGHPAIAMF